MKAERIPPDEETIRLGLSAALGMFLSETSLRHAVGETGIIEVKLSMLLENGHSRWTKGSVAFERKFQMGGSR